MWRSLLDQETLSWSRVGSRHNAPYPTRRRIGVFPHQALSG